MAKLGLRIKFILYSNALIVVTMTLVTVLAVVHERRARHDGIDRRARSVAEAMAISMAGSPSGDAISQILELNRDEMRYAMVTDSEGTVLYSSDPALAGSRIDRAVRAGAANAATVTETLADAEGAPLVEARAALVGDGGVRGSLIVGFSLEPAERQVHAVARRAVLIAVLLLVANSALTAVYVESLIRPILGLHQTLRRAAHGDFSVRSRAGSAEVGELAESFNRLMDELEEARSREKTRQVQLAHTEKMAAVGTLAAGVAHEVNNPLGGVLTCIENMRGEMDDRETLERYLDLIHDGLKRIERTVANLLDFSRQRRMVLEPTSINHNLRHVAELVEYQLRKGRVEVEFDLDPEERFVMADHFQMEQLFLNLVLNALQAMPDGGTLTLRTRSGDGRLVAEVRDTGTGIPEEIRERIFDPFFTTRDVDEGTGLGLAVSDSIVAAHGGTLVVENREERGAVFRVELPLLKTSSVGESA